MMNFYFHSDKIICKKNTSDIINFLIKKNKKVVFNLLISREQCIEKIHFFAADINDYTTCVTVCNLYPFLKYKDDIYLPLPHCIVPACTTSLLYRITENDDNLRILIGKNVIEQYLKEILEESNTFDEVSGEIEFFIKKQSQKSSDVMCRKGDKYVFFESKSLVPKRDVRCLNKDSIDLNMERICKGINQLYTQLKYFTSNRYNPFHKKENIDKNNCYGILVLLDDSYIKREDIYIKFCELYNVTINSHEYFWIINHLKVCNINNVENYAFSSSSFINSLEQQKNNKESFNYPLTNGLDNQYIQSKKVLEFKNKLRKYYVEFSNVLLKVGII